MARKRMPIGQFVQQIKAAYDRQDGYTMGATGQNPRRWKTDSHWFSQYKNAKQHAKALYWREHAARVWDCNGLAEGLYRDYAGVSIDTQAKYNYRNWCDPKGAGLIPPEDRVAGAAVFWGDSAGKIHHVAFLYEPVDPDDPGGDWYLIEARGVMYGVVMTKLLDRKPGFWGWMTKYFDYGEDCQSEQHLGDRTLQSGMTGDDVRELQEDLIRLGFDVGPCGTDGEFGDDTESALKRFQRSRRLPVTGIADAATVEALEAALSRAEKRAKGRTSGKPK